MSMRPPTLPDGQDRNKATKEGCVGLLFLLIAIFFVVIFVKQTPVQQAISTATAAATPIPTQTEPAIVLPKNTLASTPAPDPDNELIGYASELMGPAGDLQGGLHELGGLLMNPRLGSSDWMWQVATQMAIIRVSHDALTEITPPAAAATFHRHLIASTSLCSEATRKAAAGMDALDSDLLTEAAALMRACAAGLQSATVELEALAK